MSKLLKLDPEANFRFWGGPEMQKQSAGQLKSITETAFMGFWEVAKNAAKIKGFFDFAKYSIEKYDPDIIIFIDYPGFNLRMATWAKNKGYKTCYYISPQLWAWKEGRHRILKEKIDLFFVILPFERDFYLNLDTPCIYVGHPLIEVIPESKSAESSEIKTIGLFPGSRKQEVSSHLSTMMEFVQCLPDMQFIIAAVGHLPVELYENEIEGLANVRISYDVPYEVMQEIDFALASSGTATLELALHNVPQIVIYKTSTVSFMIAKRLVKTKYISLVNLIAQKEVVPELLQDAFNVLALKAFYEKHSLTENRKITSTQYAKLRKELGEGNASQKVASHIWKFLNE